MKRLAILLILFPLALPAAEAPPAATVAPQPAANEAPKPAAGQMGEESNYIIGPGDVIQVFVWRNPELTVSVPVRPDGKVSTPLVEDIVATGQTPSGLARQIEKRLSEYIRSPQVNVIVTSPQSAFSKITVIGQVKSPQALAYRKGMTAMDVVLAVGGLGDFSAGNRAKILRKDATGKQHEIQVKLADLVKKGRIKENIEMMPGDVLMVPESLF
jgi:polysaccharide biosynthesis/export protein